MEMEVFRFKYKVEDEEIKSEFGFRWIEFL